MAIEKVKAYKSTQTLKAVTTLISQNEGKLNAAWVTLAAIEAKALADAVVAWTEGRSAVDAEVVAVWAKSEEAVSSIRAEVEKTAKDEFGTYFF